MSREGFGSSCKKMQGGEPDLHVPLATLFAVSSERKAQVLDEITHGATPRPLYYVLLMASGGIATFGLLANSAAVVIGAMLVSPLMAPIFGIALALSRGDLNLLRKSAVAEFGGVLLIVGFSWVLGLLPFALEVTPEMLARTKPSLLDLIVATLAGLAAGLALVDERTSPALPGVAIATSLTPPLATTGLSLAFEAFDGAWGSFLLFFANFLAILAVSATIFIMAGFVTRAEIGTRSNVLKRFSAAGIGLLAVAAILTRQLVIVIDDWRLKQSIGTTIGRELADSPGARLAKIVYEHGAKGSLDVLATVDTPRPFSPQAVEQMQQALRKAVQRNVNLFVRCTISHDVAAEGSANILPALDLNGRFINADVSPKVRLAEIAEQTLREMVSRRRAFELRDVELLELPTGPVIIASVVGARAPVPAHVRYAEDMIRKRAGDQTASLLVRALTTQDITAKGRILLGESRFVPMSDTERALQTRLEDRARLEIEKRPDTFVNAIDAAKTAKGWKLRAEVVGLRPLEPDAIRRVEQVLGTLAHSPVHVSVLTPDGLIIRSQGFSTVQRAVEKAFLQQLAAEGKPPANDSDPSANE